MYAEIIPARRMPTTLPFLDYAVPEAMMDTLKIGQLVKIPMRNQVEFGVVKNIINQSKEKLKNISEIVSLSPCLTQKQLNFLIDISELYKTSLGFLLKTNLLPLQKRKLDNFFSKDATLKITENTPVKMPKPELYIYQNPAEQKSFYEKNITATGQNLILLPEIPNEKEIKKIIPEKYFDQLIIINSNLSPKLLFEAWLKIWTGEKRIILGTRTAIFLPWHSLTDIFLDHEGSNNYKSWEMSPRFQTRDACLILAKHHGAKLHFLANTPSVETYFFAKHGVYEIKNQLENIKFPASLINPKEERRSGNNSCLGSELIEAIKKTTGDVFLFVNRLGTYGFVVCKDCGEISNCEKCNKPYTYIRSKNNLRCPTCRTEKPVSAQCEKCHGLNLKAYGIGTQAVEDEIKKIFPDKTIIRLDSDLADHQKMTTIGQKIIIGTRLAWPYLIWDQIKVAGFLEADTPLAIPEYKALEDWWQTLRDAAFHLPPETQFFIQTTHPEHLIFQALHNPDSFYTEQLKERKILGYPPYNYLLRALFGHSQAEIVEKEAKKAYNTLISLTERDFAGKITGPIKMEPYHHNGKYWQVILAKIPYNKYKQDTKMLGKNLPEDWKIDPNPNNLLTF